MMSPIPHFDELRSLLDALCEETITAEQVRRLEELVLAHPEAEAYYVQYMSLHADLVGHFRTLPSREGQPPREHAGTAPTAEGEKALAETAQPARLPRRRLRRLGGLLLAAGLAAGLVLGFVRMRERPSDAIPVSGPAGESLDDSVAVLLQAPGADWGDMDPPPRVGAPLSPCRLRLRSGLAQLEFYSGATVILEGPADFQLISSAEAFCSQGKLRATVPPQARGFTIATPKLDLVDRGTEFGVSVNPAKTEVHVFKGRVDLYDPGVDRETVAGKELTTGRALRLEEPGAARPIETDPAAFLTVRDIQARRRAETRRRQRDWTDALAALRRDPSLVVCYSFQPEQLWSRTLHDQALGDGGGHDGAIVGCSWGTGRWPGKRGLEFKQVSDRVRFHVPGELDALTLAAWVRVDALPNRFNSLMMTDGWLEAAPHWHISHGGKLELGVQGFKNKGGVHYTTGPVFTPERLGQWTHLAVVYDRVGGQVVHYLDGRPVLRQPLKLDIALHIGDAEIGNWNVGPRKHNHPVRFLSGCVDEFLLFSRALGADEIAQFYEGGRPPS
jgi:hypothetical protein